MNRQRRSSIVLGLLLVLAGAWFLAQQYYPQLRLWRFDFSWPWYVIGAGLALFLLSMLLAAPGMMVPATIMTGIGGLLYWQNLTGNWESWSYAWSLILGFVGIGIFLAHFLNGNFRKGLREGGPLVVISVILFSIFGAFLGGLSILGIYWPVLLILIGAWFLVQPFLNRASKNA